ncbi:hypothetical protein ACLMJK_008976 [Lecanora helva]
MGQSHVSNEAAGSSKCNDKTTQTSSTGDAGISKRHKRGVKKGRRGGANASKKHTRAIKRVARIIRDLEKSNTELERQLAMRDGMVDRLCGQRDLWRRFHKTYQQEQANLETEIARGHEREQQLQRDLDLQHVRNQGLERERDNVQGHLNELEGELRETANGPMCGEPDRFCLSPVEDFNACNVANYSLMLEVTRHELASTAEAPTTRPPTAKLPTAKAPVRAMTMQNLKMVKKQTRKQLKRMDV